MNQTAFCAYPPARHDLRPERPDRASNLLERLVHDVTGRLKSPFAGRKLASIVPPVDALADYFVQRTDRDLQADQQELQRQLLAHGLTPELVARSFALIRETAGRTLGMRHYPCQLIAGRALLQGVVIEMETGEGKTLTATLTAATLAMAGIPVHVITVNDYLTARDAQIMGPLYQALGLSVGCIVHGKLPHERRQAYGCRITYATNKELVFDYLRDRLTMGERFDPLRLQAESLYDRGERTGKLLMRGLHFALVDEADSILIDEARTPLIISGSSGADEEQAFLGQALDLARSLDPDVDYLLDKGRRKIWLTAGGRRRIAARVEELGPLWSGLVRREATVIQALNALYLFQRDEQYLVREEKIEIVDEFTGRLMADRSWEQGLHQLIELKEGCELTRRRETLAKISYQRFFRRYLLLSGMTGTAREVAGELWSVYHLPMVRIAPNRPVIRKMLPDRILPDMQRKWRAVIDRIKSVHAQGRPVLVGTRSVAASELLSQQVAAAGIPHQVLNAKQDEKEADIIRRAGEKGRITIATNMAGRGTDIKLGKGVRDLGGLYVIATERHEAARIDRQLAGRGGRQGDPGTFEAILCLEDSLMEGQGADLRNRVACNLGRVSGKLGQRLSRQALGKAQKRIERYHARIRKELFLQDQQQGSLLSFSGRIE